MSKALKALILLAVVARPLGAAAVIDVPADQPTIQTAIDFAVAGDTVLVTAGTYNENIDFKGKAITVHSVNGAATSAESCSWPWGLAGSLPPPPLRYHTAGPLRGPHPFAPGEHHG